VKPTAHATREAATLCAEFPLASTRELARMLRSRHPGLYASENSARVTVQRVRAEGNQHNIPSQDTRHIDPADVVPAATDPAERAWPSLPKPKAEFDHWGAVELSGDHRALVLSDIHLPYYDRGALAVALEMGRRRDATLVLLNGDVADHYAVSHWQNDPRRRDFRAEVESVQQFLAALREGFPKARVVWKLGNHEERLERYLVAKAPELLGLQVLDMGGLYGCAGRGVELVRDMKPVKLGKLFVVHGHEYRFAIQNPVNPARGLFLRAKTLALCGHFHQTSQHSERNLEQSVVSTWSTGHLGEPHPAYRPLNNWNHGFAFVETNSAGAFEVENYRVINGTCYR
jgi:predicted phosphodiesterase